MLKQVIKPKRIPAVTAAGIFLPQKAGTLVNPGI
jgi:hypothetical protein